MTKTIDFENLSTGTVVDSEYKELGVTISGVTAQGVMGRAMIFDTAQPTGGDGDLATTAQGKALIVSEDGDGSDPDDNARGGTLRFGFDAPTTVHGMTFIDIEKGAYLHFFDADDQLIETIFVDSEDAGQTEAVFDIDDVSAMHVDLRGSGAVDNLVFADIATADGIVQGTKGADEISVDAGYTDADGDAVDAGDGRLPGAIGTDRDVIEAAAGDDIIDAGADADIVYADAGADRVAGAGGDDVLFGGNGDDTLSGGAGMDEVFGGYGTDYLAGDAGSDALYGGRGDDVLVGGVGADRIDGGYDADLIIGDAGDFVIGGAGGTDSDTLDLRGMGAFMLKGPDGKGEPVPDGNGNGIDGRVVFVDQTGTPDGRIIDFREIETFLMDAEDGAGAEDDAFVTDEDTASQLGNVLINDQAAEGLLVTAVDKDPAAVGVPVMGDRGGLITIGADGGISFDPAGAFERLAVGAKTITSVSYSTIDATGAPANAVVSITVEGRNDGPVATPNGYRVTVLENETGESFNALIDDTGDGLDSDLDGDTIQIVAVAGLPENVGQPVPGSAGGLFTIYADGEVDFDADGATDVMTAVSYTIADETGVVDSAEITFRVDAQGAAIIVGTAEGDDILTGTDGAPDVGYPFQTPVAGSSNTLPFPGYVADTDPFDQRDVIFGGAGDDQIQSGDDNDIVYGGAGDDRIAAGFDDDSVYGGTGDDTLEGSEGNDDLKGGAGDDLLYGGLADSTADLVSFPDARPNAFGFQDLAPENNGDKLSGGAGDDRLFGQDDDDLLLGGEGDDVLDGGVDNDILQGGQGDDVLFGGQGLDMLSGGTGDDVLAGGLDSDVLRGGLGDDALDGGAGDDLLIGGLGEDALFGGTGSDVFRGTTSNDVVIGGEDADGRDADVLDLRNSGVERIEYTSADRENGRVIFSDGSEMTFAEIEDVVPCFTPRTMIATPRGERLVEDLRVGDRIITRDNGIQEIAWLGRKRIDGRQLVQNQHLRPILIKRGALGQGLPERDMMVSPNHRMLVSSEKTQLYFEENEVLAAAKHMVGADGIHVVDTLQTTYIHFMFERHEVVLANGAWSESFQPGDYTLKGLGGGQRKEIFDIFPDLATTTGRKDYHAARKSLKKHEAQLLLD